MVHRTTPVVNPIIPPPNTPDWRQWGQDIVRVLKDRFGNIDRRLNSNESQHSVVVTSLTYQATLDDDLVLVNQPTTFATITLPGVPYVGKSVTVKDVGGNAFAKAIVITSHHTINGQLAVALSQAYGSVTFHFDGNGWFCDPFSLMHKGFNVSAFGAKGDGITDDTAAIQAAEDAASGPSIHGGAIVTHTLYFPTGRFNCHELLWHGRSYWLGDGPHKTFLTYNGTGGPGSYMVRNDKFDAQPDDTGTSPGAGMKWLRFKGWNDYGENVASNAIVETILDWGISGMDWGHVIQKVAFENCVGDCMVFSTDDNGAVTVNTHLESLRFDGVGGHCIVISGGNFCENRPVVIRDTTCHAHQIGDYRDALVRQGYYEGPADTAAWGKGFMRIASPKGLSIHIDTARFEMQPKSVKYEGIASLIRVDNDLDTDGTCKISMSNVNGFAQREDAMTLVHDTIGGRASLLCTHASFDNVTYWLYSPWENIPYRRGKMFFVFDANGGSFDSGILFDKYKIEFRGQIPSSGVDSMYQPGDLIFRDATTGGGGDGLGWRVEGEEGYYNTRTVEAMAGGSVDSASTTLTFTDPLHIARFPEGMWITITGAGVAAADLVTQVVTIDTDAGTATIADAASTTVVDVDIFYVAPTFVTTPGPAFAKNVIVATADNPTFTLNCTTDVNDGTNRAHIKFLDDFHNSGWDIAYSGDANNPGDIRFKTVTSGVTENTDMPLLISGPNGGRVLLGGITSNDGDRTDYGSMGLPVYNVANLSANSDGAYNGSRHLVAVFDGDAGEPCLAVCVGSGGGAEWLKIPLDSVVSATVQKPRKLPQIATASLPAASSWEGHIVYDSTAQQVLYSDGTNWIAM